MLESGQFTRFIFEEIPVSEMQQRAADFANEMAKRHSIRQFANRDVPPEIIWRCIETANTAPSGANRQPWHFVVVKNPEMKQKIRVAAESVEKEFYTHKACQAHIQAIKPLATTWEKEFLETAPYLVALFAERYRLNPAGETEKNYYVMESVGLAGGLFLAALHHAGLVGLTYTPAPDRFLNDLLERPANERLFLMFVVGYPHPDARIPALTKKNTTDVTSVFE